ncbi:MAG TPA: endonuclease III domain-containing protein [Acetivibrio sp.]|uniref:endonuclease III domain-containing protein n=1 Tax=Acetivibrio sp. TaxID=1872092 RepID=UPI002C84CCC8|nr:endonuclease III domain-containing protein [Acetivibrio sp.]HOM02194.1 endonuclease III domain-containing protein [Acetivibrio sp.]
MDIEINRKLKEIYNLMYERNGSQNWWPADTQFEVVVGALLAQFVSWKNVETAIQNLERENLLSIEGICNAETEKLEELVRSTRFYKQKARKLKEFCGYVKEKYNADLDNFFDKDIYELRDELLSLYGIGEETADSIILYAAEKPIFVVDAYTRRVFGRLGYFKEDITYGQMQKFFMDNLEHDTKLFNDFHAQIVGVGNKHCNGKKTDCKTCPLESICKKCGAGL